MKKDRLIQKIIIALEKEPVRLAYLYGSYAKGKTHKKSDIDIAVVLEPHAKRADYQIGGNIYDSLQPGGPEIDVREINSEKDPTFLINVLSPAKPILVKDEKERIEFETKAFERFYDIKHLRDINYLYLTKRIKEGKYGTGIPNYQKIA